MGGTISAASCPASLGDPGRKPPDEKGSIMFPDLVGARAASCVLVACPVLARADRWTPAATAQGCAGKMSLPHGAFRREEEGRGPGGPRAFPPYRHRLGRSGCSPAEPYPPGRQRYSIRIVRAPQGVSSWAGRGELRRLAAGRPKRQRDHLSKDGCRQRGREAPSERRTFAVGRRAHSFRMSHSGSSD